MLCITCIVTSTPGMKLWNVTFMGCTCDSESEPHTCVVIYRQLQCVCGIVLGNSRLQCVFGNSVTCKSQLQCACGIAVYWGTLQMTVYFEKALVR